MGGRILFSKNLSQKALFLLKEIMKDSIFLLPRRLSVIMKALIKTMWMKVNFIG